MLHKWGVRQGCILSSLLFNVYSEQILKMALDNTKKKGILINWERLNNIGYVNDIVVFADSLENLQHWPHRSQKSLQQIEIKQQKLEAIFIKMINVFKSRNLPNIKNLLLLLLCVPSPSLWSWSADINRSIYEENGGFRDVVLQTHTTNVLHQSSY